MYHTGNLSLVFCLDRDTVTAISHGDNGILQVIACASVDERRKLCMDSVSGKFHISTNLTEITACVIADFVL